MFRSEEAKMKVYRANLAREAKNQFIQGEKLDEYLLYEKGIEAQEKGTTHFAEAIGEQIGKNMRTVGTVDKMKQWVGADDVDEYGSVLKSKNAPKGKSPIVGDVDEFGNVLKAKSKNPPKSIKQPSKPRKMISNNRELENQLMGMEDKAPLPDLIDLDTYLDVMKPNVKLDANLVKLDTNLRQLFMDELDDMLDANEKAKSAKKAKENVMITRLQDLIEKQSLADAFDKFTKDATTAEFASKIQRNLKAIIDSKKKIRMYSVVGDALEEEKKVKKALGTIAERMAELRARKAKKRADSSSSASTATSSPPTSNESQKKRGPKGRPKGTLSAKKTEEVLARLGQN